jgi:hypothetical protein
VGETVRPGARSGADKKTPTRSTPTSTGGN